MAFVTRAAALNKSLNTIRKFSITAQCFAGWNKDFKPAPFPQTEKERLDAAKKYNVLPSLYQPYADDGLGHGDYPKFEPGFGVESKDSYYPYDFPEHRRNFQETFHADHDMYSEDRYSQPDRPRFSSAHYFGWFIGCMTFFLTLYYWLDTKRMFRPVLPKQYPNRGVKHYTFESN